jgi:hypothetical protein
MDAGAGKGTVVERTLPEKESAHDTIKGFFRTLSVGRLRFPLAKRPEPTLGDSLVRMPMVVPGQVDGVPGQRRQVL